MSFAEFTAQEGAVDLLRKSLERGRLGHAYLVSGSHLGEMERLAAALAKTINCLAPPARGRTGLPLAACGACLSCRKIEALNHPDITWVRPESKSRIITIEQIRDLIQRMNLKANEAAHKVSIIVDADRLNNQSANAFLKTLEEPSAGSVIILLTTALERVLETIVSRCLRLHLASDSRLHLEADDRAWLAAFGEEAVTGAKSLLGRYRLLDLLVQRLTRLREIIDKRLTDASPLTRHPDAENNLRDKWEEELKAAIEAEYRRKRAEAVLVLQWWMRDVWLQSHRIEGVDLALPDLSECTAGLARRIGAAAAAGNLRSLEGLQRLLHTNVQESLALEVGLLRLKL